MRGLGIHTLAIALLLGILLPVTAARAVVRSSKPDDQIARMVKFQPRRGARVPLDVEVRDGDGPAALGALTDHQPFILTMVWFGCRNLCGLTLNGLADSLSKTAERPGQGYQVVVLSMDPAETPAAAAERQQQLAGQYPRADVGGAWHFVTASEPVVDAVADAIGFHYVYDTDKQQFAHPAGLIAVTAAGRISDWLTGINYTPAAVDGMLATTAGARPPPRSDPVLLLCYDYDPQTGQYSFAILKFMRLLAVIVLLALGGYMARSVYRERRSRGDG